MTKFEIIDTFIRNVSMLKEADFGDFKRKANSYLLRMEDALHGPTLPQEAQRQILEIKDSLVYHPSFNVSTTQNETVRRAETLKSLA